jgi:hypothetical protein
MSDCYYNLNNPTSKIRLPNLILDQQGDFETDYVPRDSIEWSEILRDNLIHFYSKCNYPYRNITDIPFGNPLKSEIRRFFIALDAYIDSPDPAIPEKLILKGSADKDFAKYLKRLKQKSVITSWGSEPYSTPDWWDKVDAYRINDIGQIFNFAYLIFFKDDVDDYLEGFSPVNINGEILSRFEETLFDLLPDRDSFDEIDRREVLLEVSGSMCIDNNFKSKPHYLQKPKELFFSKKRSPVKRSVIPVSPNNTRDSVLNRPADLNTISLIDKQVNEILRKMEGHIHLRDKDRCTKICKNLHEKYTLFLHRDLKKEGITKPRQLLKSMLRTLNRKYPDLFIFENYEFYDSFCLIQDGEKLFPERGHGLGCANSLTTLMQLTIHDLIVDELLDNIPNLDALEIALNDDFVVGFNDEYHVDSYWDMEEEILEGLGILRQPEKSFSSRNNFVIAERYFGTLGEHKKISYKLREVLLPLACFNIVHAKAYISAVQTYVEDDLVSQYIKEISQFWGYEFFPTEVSYPIIFGGWLNPKMNGVDLSLTYLDELPLKDYVFRGAKAAATRPIKKRSSKNFYESPSSFLLDLSRVPEKYLPMFDIEPIDIINDKYGRNLTRSEAFFKKFWRNLKTKRLKTFNKRLDMSLDDLILYIMKKYRNIEFYPCEDMVYKYHASNSFEVSIEDYYIDPNPKTALISYFSEIDYEFKEVFSVNFTEPDNFYIKGHRLYSKEAQRTLKSEKLSIFYEGIRHEYFFPDGFDPNEQYISPIKIGVVARNLNFFKGYPEKREIFKDLLIEEKREIFGRFLSLKEMIWFKSKGLTRTIIKRLIQHCHSIEDMSYVLDEFINLVHQRENTQEEIVYKQEIRSKDILTFADAVSEDGCSLFYAWRTDKSLYKVEKRVEQYWDELDCAIMQLSLSYMNFHNANEALDEILSGSKGEEIRIMSKIYNLENLEITTETDLSSAYDEGLSLFQEDDY